MGVNVMLIPNKPINTANQIISVSGKVFYNDRRRRIDIKKPIRDLFESTSLDVNYIMELCLSESSMQERIKKLSEHNIVPVLLYFTSVEGEQE